MDLLKAELERKRKAVALAKKSSDVGRIEAGRGGSDDNSRRGQGRAYLKAADLRRFQEQQEEQLEEERRRRKAEAERVRSKKKRRRDEEGDDSSGPDASTKDVKERRKIPHDDSEGGNSSDEAKGRDGSKRRKAENDTHQHESGDGEKKDGGQNLSPSDVTKMLRELGLPIRLFGERTVHLGKSKYDDTQRLKRLNEAKESQKAAMAGMSEMDEFRLGSGHGIRNPFLGSRKHGGADDEVKEGVSKKSDGKSMTTQHDKKSSADTSVSKSGKERTEKQQEASKDDNKEDNNEDDPHKRIYHFFKTLLRQWEDDLARRPDSVKRTAAGKNETKTLKQCKDYIRPLFKLCKTRRLDENIMAHLLRIVDFCEQGEFVKAHDAYIDVAIGRAAWPIGVTMVGIHARSGRAKIESSNVAHVMNSELQRKYLTSVKRLMSYCQKKRPDVDPSKKVMNM